MKRLAAITFSILISLQSFAFEGHQVWDRLLKGNVNEIGEVDYKGFYKNQKELDAYLQLLSESVPDESWERAEAMAYWINAYNAFTVKLILNTYPVESIMDINDGKAWDLKFFELGGEKYSLNQIEHEILRPTYQDARIHFAVNCASFSCPILLNQAYTAENLEKLLDQQAQYFINNIDKNSISADKVEISKLFEWYAEDFTKEGSLIEFLNQYSNTQINPSAKVEFKEYSWKLNEK